jgi:hypothetical protein
VKQRVLARDLPKPNKPDPNNPAASAATTEEDDRVPIDIPALRSRLQLSEEQLPDDATEEQINAVLASDPSTEPEPSPEEPEPTPEPEPQPEPAAVNEPDPIAATQARTSAGHHAAASPSSRRRPPARRDRTPRTPRRPRQPWVREGRIAPAERDHYRGLLDVDEDRTVALAARCARPRPGRERGTDTPPPAGGITRPAGSPS